MEYHRLGDSDLLVSSIAFGGEAIGGTDWGPIDDKQSLLAIGRALDCGINLFDTADAYGLGRSEEILAKGLGAKRKDVIIATKFGVNWTNDPNGGRARTRFDSSPRHTLAALEASLRRLQIDVIPLYQIHWPDPKTPIGDTLEALIQAREAGKIKHIGVSNFSIDQIREAQNLINLSSVQISYNLLSHRSRAETVNHCARMGTGVIVYGVLAQGLLTGKYDAQSTFGSDDRRSRLLHFQGVQLERNLAILDLVSQLAARYGKTSGQVAIRWVLQQPGVTCAAIGSKTPAQVDENVAAMEWRLAEEDVAYLSVLSEDSQNVSA